MSRYGVSALLLSVVILAGCGAGGEKSIADDTGAITVHCNSSSLRWNACYEAAANVCGQRGYQIVHDGAASMPTVTTNAMEVPVIGDSMVIRCNQ